MRRKAARGPFRGLIGLAGAAGIRKLLPAFLRALLAFQSLSAGGKVRRAERT